MKDKKQEQLSLYIHLNKKKQILELVTYLKIDSIR